MKWLRAGLFFSFLWLSGCVAVFKPERVCITDATDPVKPVMRCYDSSLNATELPIQDRFTCFSPDDSAKLEQYLNRCAKNGN